MTREHVKLDSSKVLIEMVLKGESAGKAMAVVAFTITGILLGKRISPIGAPYSRGGD